jgi:endonuclease/exonuclease/phosphatase family metal-dependent hydrolase
MKLLRYSFSLLFLTLLLTSLSQAQFFENFDSGEKAGYTGASVTLSTGNWFLDDALLGSLSNDKFNGSQSVRMDRRDGKMGNIFMQFDKPNGADEVSFQLAHYGNNSEDAALQVQYSTDSGSSWTNVGDVIIAPAELTEYTIAVEVEGNIRFKFIQSAGTDRMNIDDIRITDYVEASAEATISVLVDNATANNSDMISFGATLEGKQLTKTMEIKNTGNPDLVISDVTVTGEGFSSSTLSDSTLAFNETTDLTLTFEPTSDGTFQGNITITSNADNASSFSLTLSGEGFADGDVISIVDARQLPLGTRVTVAGRVTVANQFGGPLYMQDATAGIAVFWEPLHIAAEIGDSIQVSGPLTVFKGGVPGADEDFLLQISDTEEDDNIVYEVFDVEKVDVTPKIVNLEQLNMEANEGQLVVVQNVTIDHSGAFQGNQNYAIADGIGTAEMRIDNNTNLVDAIAPTEPANIIGVIGQFGGTYQLLPRFTEDMGVEEVSYPGDNITKDQTLDVVTWNVEWFGDAGNGPEDDDLQLRNVITVVETIDADIYALQEISSPNRFNALVDSLEGYGGFLAEYSQTQETAFLFKRSSIDSLSGVTLSSSDGFTQSNWANGRYPLMFRFTADINDEQQEVYAFNIHAKAFGDQSSYNQRVAASAELKEYLDRNRASDNVIMIGDYNDEIVNSTFNDNVSPYKNFDDDPEYTIVTKKLEENGFGSQSSGSFIDHITFTSELSDDYFEGTERVENPFYVGSYLSTTSDHFPIWMRFKFGVLTSNDDEIIETPTTVSLNQNYPNPFNPSTTISYTLDSSTNVRLNVYDITGRKVATLVNGRQVAGAQEVRFDASSLASGVYIYRLETATGANLTKKMVLIK